MFKVLQTRVEIDRPYVSRKEGERGLASIEDSVDAFKQRLENSIKKRKGRLITATRNNTDNTIINGINISRKHKQLYGHFCDKEAKYYTRKLGHG